MPVYVNAKEVVDGAGRPEALELNYCTFYAWNGHYSVAGFRVGAHAGAHASPLQAPRPHATAITTKSDN